MLKHNKKWSKEIIIEEIKKIKIIEGGVAPSIVLKKNPSLFYAAIRKQYFGSWKIAIEAAGLSPDNEYKKSGRTKIWSREKVIAMLKTMSSDELHSVRKLYPSLYNAACRYFSSWKKALFEAGLLEEYLSYKEKKILEELADFIRENQNKSVYKYNKSLYDRVYAYFGSLDNALKKIEEKNG